MHLFVICWILNKYITITLSLVEAKCTDRGPTHAGAKSVWEPLLYILSTIKLLSGAYRLIYCICLHCMCRPRSEAISHSLWTRQGSSWPGRSGPPGQARGDPWDSWKSGEKCIGKIGGRNVVHVIISALNNYAVSYHGGQWYLDEFLPNRNGWTGCSLMPVQCALADVIWPVIPVDSYIQHQNRADAVRD